MAVFEVREEHNSTKVVYSCHSNYSEYQNFFRKREAKAVGHNGTRAAQACCASRPLAIDEVYAQYVGSWTHQNCTFLSLTMASFEYEWQEWIAPRAGPYFGEMAFCLCQRLLKFDHPVGWTFLMRSVTVSHLLKEWLENKTQQNRQTSWPCSKGKGWSFLFFRWIPLWDASPCFPLACGQALLCEGTWIWRDLQCTRLFSLLQRKVWKVIIFWQL